MPIRIIKVQYRKTLVATLMVAFVVNCFGQSTAEKISITFNDLPIEQAIIKLSQQSNQSIVFSSSFFSADQNVNASFNDVPIDEILGSILKNTGLSVKQKGNLYIIKKQQIEFFNLYGFIQQSGSAERLAFASLYISSIDKAAISNDQGYYSLSLPAGTHVLEVSYLGHQTKKIQVDIHKHHKQNILLSTSNILQEVIIDESLISKSEPSKNRFSYDRLMHLSRRTPGIGGSNDVLHTTKSIAGVQTGSGGIGGYFVRGGSNDQNLFLLDGVSIYNPFHSLGLSSIFTPHATKSLQLYKSGFRPQYGDKSASVVDIKLKDGNRNRLRTTGGFNPQDAFLSIEGPIKKGVSSFFIHGRKSTLLTNFNNVIRQSLFTDPLAESKINYYDIIAKLNTSIGSNNELFLSYYKGQDQVDGEIEDVVTSIETVEETNLSWGNEIVSMRWQSLINSSVFLNVSANVNTYFSQLGFLSSFEDSSDELFDLFFNLTKTNNRDEEAKIELDYNVNSRWRIKGGVGYLRQKFRPNFSSFTEESDELDDIAMIGFTELSEITSSELFETSKSFNFIETTYNTTNVNLQFGFRNTLYKNDHSKFFHFQPRVNASFYINDSNILSLSASNMVQYVHLLSSSEINLPRDLWFPSSDQLLPETSWHYNLAYTKRQSDKWSFLAELYYKNTRNKRAPTEDFLIETNDFLNLFQFEGSGRSYGLELSASLTTTKIQSTISYTLGRSDLQFDELNLSKSFPYQFDRRHEFKTISSIQLSPYITLGVSTYLSSGHPILVTTTVDPNSGLQPVDIDPLGSKNKTRTGFQHRLDLSLLYERQILGLQHTFKVNLYNSYNQSSPLFYTLGQGGSLDLRPSFAIPLIPSFSYTVHF